MTALNVDLHVKLSKNDQLANSYDLQGYFVNGQVL